MPRRSRQSRLNFAELFFPARPAKLVLQTRRLVRKPLRAARRLGLPTASNPAYVSWLKRHSMLQAANRLAAKYSGRGTMWRNPFARPRPRSAVKLAGVWYTAYPISLITKSSQSILANLAEDDLWQAFETIGIKAIHTGPMKLAGGLNGWDTTPSIDGHFDRISNRIDPAIGTEAEFRHLSEAAARHNGIVIDDIVPGHTGKGADFRLAEMNYGDYPGIYHMVEIAKSDWSLLPNAPKGRDSINIDSDVEAALKEHGYIVGKLPRVIFYEPGKKDTNWSATKVIRGVDGERRRWVYLHYFKDGQPSINWLDPSFAGMRLVIGDALHSIGELGTKGLRLDANGFLGIEMGSEDQPAWSEGHPLSEAANLMIAGTVRKLNGFTFQELNLSMDDIKTMGQSGADLSYDFVSRPAYHHALLQGNTEFLRLVLRNSLEIGIDPSSLVHALQNHDELTYELVHFWYAHKDDIYRFRGSDLTGHDLRLVIRQELRDKLTKGKPYNLPFTENGIACTTISVIAAALDITDLDKLTDDQIETIQKAHLLLVMFNGWQPGVLALSGWDLVGALPLGREQVSGLLEDGDTRWINRGAYDLMNHNSNVQGSNAGMPKARNLYGDLPAQLALEDSFASQLQQVIEIRNEHGISTAYQVDIPEVSHHSMLVMVHRLNHGDLQVTVLNFSNEPIEGSVTSTELPPGASITDVRDDSVWVIDELHTFHLSLAPFQGRFLLVTP
jgi:trehalose synthase